MSSDNGLPIVKVLGNQGKSLTVQDSSGAIVTRTGDRNWRGNNPGNLVDNKYTRQYEGYVGFQPATTDANGNPVPAMAVFDTMENGYKAQARLLGTSDYQNRTLASALEKYDSVDAKRYLAIVQKETGLPADIKLKDLTPTQMAQLRNVMSTKVEGRLSGKITSGSKPTQAEIAAAPTSKPASTTTTSTTTGPTSNPTPALTAAETARLKGTTLNQQQAQALTELTGRRTRLEAQIKQAKLLSAGAITPDILSLQLSLKRVNEEINRLTGTFGIVNAEKPTQKSKKEPAVEKAKVKDTVTQIALSPLPNRLHQYPSYIYSLSLHLLTNEEYNAVVDTHIYTPKNVLIASAGRWSADTFPRNKFFTEDFYFEDLNLVTTIAPNDRTGNTNGIDVTFTVVEPYGFTLIERILKACDELKSSNYLDMPYLLQIDFFAMGNDGSIVGALNEHQKRIPMKLNMIDVNVTARGAEYKIGGTPFSHAAYEATAVTTPANFEITAGSVAEFFQSIEGTEADTATARASVENQREKTNSSSPANTSNAVKTASGSGFTKVKSYGTAINAWYKALKDANKTSGADVYRFEFDSDIGNSLFTDRLRSTPKETAMKDNRTPNDVATMKKADLGSSQNTYDTSKAIFQINYGTTITKLLEYIIKNSDYIQDQLIVPEDPNYESKKAQLKDQPLDWFRIVPTVRLLSFDTRKNLWTKEITYHVKKYTMYNIRSDVGPQGVARNPVKTYNYIYTGKNIDVLDFQIQFQALYYNQVTAYRDNLSAVTPTAESHSTDAQADNASTYVGGNGEIGPNFNAIAPTVTKPVVQNSKAAATGGATSAKETASVDLADSLMTNSEGDMVGVKLKIIGDPDFIKQDDVFYTPKLNEDLPKTTLNDDPRLLLTNGGGGSLVMDEGMVLAQVLFRTPIDIDESTGMMKFDPNYKHSLFSGMYQVIQVTSHFTKGMFTQELELSRLPRQIAFDYVDGQDPAADPNRTELKPQAIGTVQPPVAPVKTAPASNAALPSPATAADTNSNQTPGSSQPVAQINNAESSPAKPDQAALMAVNNNKAVPTESITAVPQAVVATPDPVPPSTEKLALKEKADAAYTEKIATNKASNDASDAVVALSERADRAQALIERYTEVLKNPNSPRYSVAQATIDQNKAELAEVQSQLPAAEAKAKELSKISQAAASAYVDAQSAYVRAV